MSIAGRTRRAGVSALLAILVGLQLLLWLCLAAASILISLSVLIVLSVPALLLTLWGHVRTGSTSTPGPASPMRQPATPPGP